MRPTREVVVRADGTIVASDATATEMLSERVGRYRLVDGAPGLLLLERIDENGAAPSRVLASGEIVAKTTVLDMVSFVGSNGWRGELTVLDGTYTRRLTLDQGALKGAFSDAPSERLGEVMVSLGAITPDQLARVVLSGSAGRRFGEIAVEQGFTDQKLLFEMLQAQAQRTFLAALLVQTGRYAFTLMPEDTDAPTMTLHLPVQSLLMESVQRIDEMAYFRERIPSGDVRPVMTETGIRITLRDSLRPIAMLVDGSRSIYDIGRELRLDEFQVTKQVMQLLQLGCVEVKEQPKLTRENVDRIVRQLNEILREVRDTVERHSGLKGAKQVLWTLQTWVAQSEIASYFGTTTRLDGDISVDATLRQLQNARLDRPLEELHRAAHELVSFAMFCASPTLPREAERALSKWVNQRLTRMRL
jgi:hypothetical protein